MNIVLTILVILACILAIIGIVGAFVPVIPGPPVSFVALLIVYFVLSGTVSTTLLILMGIISLIVTILDFFAPVIITKIGGGSKYAVWGSAVGIVVGLLYLPLGLIICPLLGAFVGEMLCDSRLENSIKVAFLSFVSFIVTTGLKLILCLIIAFYSYYAVFSYIADWVKQMLD